MYRPNEHGRIEADFGKLIAHYLNKCYPDDRDVMYAELWGFLYDMVNRGRAISQRYVAVSIRNKYIECSRELQKERALETELKDEYLGTVKDDFVKEIEMRELLEKLGIKQREAVVLHHVYGLTFDEIAKKNGCTRQAINKLEKRGLKTLRQFLIDEERRIKECIAKGEEDD